MFSVPYGHEQIEFLLVIVRHRLDMCEEDANTEWKCEGTRRRKRDDNVEREERERGTEREGQRGTERGREGERGRERDRRLSCG